MLRRLARRGIAIAFVLACGCAGARTQTPAPSDPGAVAGPVADAFMRRHPADTLPWNWGEAVALLGLARWAEAERDHGRSEAIWDYLARHQAEHARGRGPVVDMPDHAAPGLPALALLGARPHDHAAATNLARVAAYFDTEPRNELGALDHLGRRTTLGRLYPRSIWIDSLVMYGVTAAWLGQARGDRTLEAFAFDQPEIFARVLQDPGTGLFRHAYLHERGRTRPREPVFWLRGNGWVAAATIDLLERMSPSHPLHARTRALFEALVHGLLACRGHDGLWTTVLCDPRTYTETSGSALVAYALAKGARLGILPPEHRDVARATWAALASRVRRRGGEWRVTGTSRATIPSCRLGYALVPRGTDVPWGVGAMLLLAAELDRHERAADREP